MDHSGDMEKAEEKQVGFMRVCVCMCVCTFIYECGVRSSDIFCVKGFLSIYINIP